MADRQRIASITAKMSSNKTTKAKKLHNRTIKWEEQSVLMMPRKLRNINKVQKIKYSHYS